eukprot:TRINITY_DN4510_c0_g1_i6.p1 TRINITY_DN4510_c0_g1~~TRINITY_DN4510_c0_g1_i6.p1  ORF type:complete len:277 (-),score=53.92 TRINITY_DN4510_c0_g1_i6:756-1550(-)
MTATTTMTTTTTTTEENRQSPPAGSRSPRRRNGNSSRSRSPRRRNGSNGSRRRQQQPAEQWQWSRGNNCSSEQDMDPEPSEIPEEAMQMVRMKVMSYGMVHVEKQKFEEPETDCSFDVRHLRDPEVGDLKFHDGRHPEIAYRLVRHTGFQRVMGQIRAQLAEKLRQALDSQSTDKIRIGIYCSQGRHRSVATADLLHSILEKEGFQSEVEHCTFWRPCHCRICDTNPRSGSRTLAMNMAHAYREKVDHCQKVLKMKKWKRAGRG